MPCVLESHLEVEAICIGQFSVYTCVYFVVGTIGLLPGIGNTLNLGEQRPAEGRVGIHTVLGSLLPQS